MHGMRLNTKLEVTRHALAGTTLLLLAGCAHDPGQDHEMLAMQCGAAAANEVTVQINAEGCAHEVQVTKTDCADPGDKIICAKRNESVKWVSSDDETQFRVYFDPFLGPPDKANANGCLRKNVDSSAPLGEYKYTIVTVDHRGNPIKSCPVYDPKIIVQP